MQKASIIDSAGGRQYEDCCDARLSCAVSPGMGGGPIQRLAERGLIFRSGRLGKSFTPGRGPPWRRFLLGQREGFAASPRVPRVSASMAAGMSVFAGAAGRRNSLREGADRSAQPLILPARLRHWPGLAAIRLARMMIHRRGSGIDFKQRSLCGSKSGNCLPVIPTGTCHRAEEIQRERLKVVAQAGRNGCIRQAWLARLQRLGVCSFRFTQ